MTHEELLAKIDYELKAAEFEDICGDGGHPPTHKALRAVVELHKPDNHCNYCATYCKICNDSKGEPVFYPCPTIQAIEKELGL